MDGLQRALRRRSGRTSESFEEANSLVEVGRRALAVYFNNGFKRATVQVLFFNPEAKVDEVDPFKVIVDGKLVDEE